MRQIPRQSSIPATAELRPARHDLLCLYKRRCLVDLITTALESEWMPVGKSWVPQVSSRSCQALTNLT